MPNFSNFADLEKFLQKKIDIALEKDVVPKVKEVMKESIDKVVYQAYTPDVYERRESGGFGDESNFEHELVSPGEIYILNTTPANPRYRSALRGRPLREAIITGNHYHFFSPGPRDYVSDTYNRLQQSGAVEQALKDGLLKQGIKAE